MCESVLSKRPLTPAHSPPQGLYLLFKQKELSAGLLSANKWMQNKFFKKIYIHRKPQNLLLKSSHFSFRPFYIIHQKIHHITLQFVSRNQFGWVSVLYSLTQRLPNFLCLFCLPGQAGTNGWRILLLQRITQISSPHSRRTSIFLLHLHLGKTGGLFPWKRDVQDRTAAQHRAQRTRESTFQKLETATETAVTIRLLGKDSSMENGLFLASDGTWYSLRGSSKGLNWWGNRNTPGQLACV